MNYQEFTDQFRSMTCLISVERLPDGNYGTIRIAAGSKSYVDSIENPSHMASSSMLENKFIPGSEYTRYIPKDLTFENICYQAALLGRPMHTYVSPDRYPFWINVFVMPLVSDDPDIGYCTYTMELSAKPDTELMVDLPPDISASVLSTCIKLRRSGDMKSNFMEVVGDIRALCSSDHCCILLTDNKNRSCEVLGESIKEGSDLLPMQTYLDDAFFAIIESWPDTIAGSRCFIAKDREDMKILRTRNPAWYDSLIGAGISSIVLFPLEYAGEIHGYIWATNFDITNTIKIMETLELSTFFIAAEIANYQLVDKLRIMSTIDLLTGTKNRNAMNTCVDRIVSGERRQPSGIIFCDINGLKHINDCDGHNAGDTLIKNAAAVLIDECSGMKTDIYRAGGDEFMIIVDDADNGSFEDLIRSLKEHSDSSDGVNFAVGGCFLPDGMDIRLAMHTADEQMYLDKVRYYEKYPERKRT
ncbi:MAG: GGDEF domain-containing protein [Oscillospiraceae bacterium]|nr:GGDEF domain-containing protein [Oscillospiraceae bacterium]